MLKVECPQMRGQTGGHHQEPKRGAGQRRFRLVDQMGSRPDQRRLLPRQRFLDLAQSTPGNQSQASQPRSS